MHQMNDSRTSAEREWKGTGANACRRETKQTVVPVPQGLIRQASNDAVNSTAEHRAIIKAI
jgi:hypothetical protein